MAQRKHLSKATAKDALVCPRPDIDVSKSTRNLICGSCDMVLIIGQGHDRSLAHHGRTDRLPWFTEAVFSGRNSEAVWRGEIYRSQEFLPGRTA